MTEPEQRRWVPTRRIKQRRRWVYQRLTTETFEDVRDVLRWLIREGYLEVVANHSEETYYPGWGTKFFACLDDNPKVVNP